MTDADGTTTYTYDALDRIVAVAYPSSAPGSVAYAYDPMSNRLSMTQDGVETAYTYDAADRLVSKTTAGLTTDYTWDNDGNLLTKGDQTFTWNKMGKLETWTDGTAVTSYVYNGDGVRVGYTVDGITSAYLQDLAGGMAVVLREETNGAAIDYLYGIDLIAQRDGASARYLIADGLGSTRFLTDENGSVIARYYDPEDGRFISVDPIPADRENIQGLNSYVYVINNPIKYVDPEGEVFNFATAAIGAAAGAAISSAWYYVVDVKIGGEVYEPEKLIAKAASGAVTGAMAGFTGGASLAATAAMGATKGLVGYGVENMLYNTLKGNDLTHSMSIGGAIKSSAFVAISSSAIKGIENIPGYLKPDLGLPVGQLNLFNHNIVGGDWVSVTAYEGSKKVFSNIIKTSFSVGLDQLGYRSLIWLNNQSCFISGQCFSGGGFGGGGRGSWGTAPSRVK